MKEFLYSVSYYSVLFPPSGLCFDPKEVKTPWLYQATFHSKGFEG